MLLFTPGIIHVHTNPWKYRLSSKVFLPIYKSQAKILHLKKMFFLITINGRVWVSLVLLHINTVGLSLLILYFKVDFSRREVGEFCGRACQFKPVFRHCKCHVCQFFSVAEVDNFILNKFQHSNHHIVFYLVSQTAYSKSLLKIFSQPN